MGSKLAEVYDKFAGQIEEQLRNQFPDVAWKVARYDELSKDGKIEQQPDGSETAPGMFISGEYGEKGQMLVMPNTFLTEGTLSINGVQGTIFMIGERMSAELRS